MRSQLEISETSLRREILGVHKRLDTLELRVSSLELKFTHLEDKFELLRHELRQEIRFEIQEAEARLMKHIDRRITRMAFGFGIPFVVTNISLVASVFYR